MATPAPAPVPAPAPAPLPATTPSAPTPGYATSEAWVTLLVIIVGALPSSGLLVGAPPVVIQVVGIISAVLAALGYTTNRTSLKKAHLALGAAPANDNVTPTRATQAGFIRTRVMLVLAAISIAFAATCAGVQKWTGDFVGCEKANFGLQLSWSTISGDVLTVVKDLILANPTDLEAQLAALAVQSSQITINCAIQATLDFFSGGSGSGSAGSAVPTVAQIRAARERALAQYPGLGRALAWAAAHPVA